MVLKWCENCAETVQKWSINGATTV
jgi:hypothetical protein